ncbi:hypothetical protein NQ315_005911 [Exocentrus adspersus]|uniref:Uncharacterized protein n=1 Tax=Exocentrus adspersus TaxID=1586481 RepID=A0AAV8V9G5_9CUCU|nr:hypothetical protein NQ315_005911 [Exocentrus adspersus]
MRDPEISQLVRLARHKTISEALAQALEIEAAKEASRAINPYQAPGPSTSQVRQIRVYTRQNQDVKMKKTHTYLDDWMYQILEKYENRRHSKNSTFNKTR